MSIKQRATVEQPFTTVIDGHLIQRGGNFMFNDELFDGYVSVTGCTKFRDAQGNPFESINIFHVVPVNALSTSLYVSTNKGLFLYNSNTGVATNLSYALTDMIFMQMFYNESNQTKNVLFGYYLRNEDGRYGIRKITFTSDGTLTQTSLSAILPNYVKWMRRKNIINTSFKISTGNAYYPICYGKDENSNVLMWVLKWTAPDNKTQSTFAATTSFTISNITDITEAINQNTILIDTGTNVLYTDISYIKVAGLSTTTPKYENIGNASTHKVLTNISLYDQHYMNRNNIASTFMLVVNNDKDADTYQQLSFGYIVYNEASDIMRDGIIYHVDTDESDGKGINGGYVHSAINHRMYTIVNTSGYKNGSKTYATRRHIFASSTRLMDINDNPLAVLKHFRGTSTAEKNNYPLLPVTGKTPIFTINASIEIDPDKNGNVLATDYNSVKKLYYIYTDSHIGIYFITMRQLTWIASDIMTQIHDIWSFSDITVIDGYAKDIVNGIMTTTEMNGPTFDQLFAEIDELRKRIAALESK